LAVSYQLVAMSWLKQHPSELWICCFQIQAAVSQESSHQISKRSMTAFEMAGGVSKETLMIFINLWTHLY
jgi:hypothetical protein